MKQVPTDTVTAYGMSFNPGDASCPICRSQTLSRFSARAFDAAEGVQVSVVECADCGFAWQFPLRRSADESAKYFADAYQSNCATPGGYFDARFKSQIALLEFAFVAGLPTQGRRLLDVGAGAGLFAREAAKSGWEVTALDPAMDPSAFANTTVRALRGTPDVLSEDETFDVITLWDVIEHVDDPVRLISTVMHRLRPGGWIVVETGNYKSADRVSGGLTHWIYQLDHRWYFAPDSLRRLLTHMRFFDGRFADRVLRPGWQGSSIYRAPSLLKLIRDMLRRPMSARTTWHRHAQLRRASEWPLAGLPIFCFAARRS